MEQTQSTVSGDSAKSSMIRAVTPALQKSSDHDGGQTSVSAQRAVNTLGGGNPQAAPGRYGSALEAMSGSPARQAGMLRQLQRSYGNSFVGGVIQRKCECGGTCGSCGDEKKIQRKGEGSISHAPSEVAPAIQRSGEGSALDHGTRSFMESGFGYDFGGVRVHADSGAAQASRGLRAQAFTMGRDIYFASGRYQPQTHDGQRLLAHELTHVVQQDSGAASGNMSKSLVSEPGDVFEREADATAERIVGGGSASSSAISAGSTPDVQRYSWDEFVSDVEGVAESAGEAIEDVGDAIVGIASEVWEFAQGVASALGGSLSFSGGMLIINVPSFQVCDAYDAQFSLPEIGKDFTFLYGVIPVAEVVDIYGSLGLHVGLTPEISGQIGPCQLNGLRIAIDPLAPSFGAAGGITVTAALGLGAELRVGLHGEVGILIIWPDPPLVLEIPVAAIEGGLAGFARGIIAHTFTVSGSMAYSSGAFSFNASVSDVMGLAADLGLAGYGSLEVLGQNLCTLYWPLLEWHGATTLSLGGSLDLAIDSSGASLDVQIDEPVWDDVPFDEMGIDIGRSVLADDCPLCDALYSLGLMPSQNGGAWTGHPAPPWGGPLFVYPSDPLIPSESLCRGACGSNCDTCSPPEEKVECEDTGDGHHQWWHYPNYQVCGSHQGCRDHDACYDWCAATFGEKGMIGLIFGPCHRACDFECVCNYGAKQCVGWIGGGKPHDRDMYFSEQPYITPGCKGPCPEESEESPTGYRLCLPDIELFGRRSFRRGTSGSTRQIPIFTTTVDVPYIGPVVIHVFAQGRMSAQIGAGLGPAWLANACLDVDPYGSVYRGSAELHLKAGVDGLVKLTGIVDASANWLCLIEVLGIEGGLTATGTGEWENELIDTIEISCRDGEIVLDNDLSLESCLELGFDLDAHLKLRLFTFTVLEEQWNLLSESWRKCWNGIDLLALPSGGADPSFIAPAIGIAALLATLFAAANPDVDTPTLPADPARESNSTNPCGGDVPDEDCGSQRLPLTHVDFFPGPQGQGGRVKASPLTRCEGNTHGSQPDQSIYATQFACIRNAGEGGRWVRAHLLHGETSGSGPRNLHGPGDDMRNLIITDKSLNGTMSSRAERPALDRVHGPTEEVLWYESTVDSYAPGRDFFGQSITVNFGSFDTNTGTEGPRLGGGTFTLRRTPPNCP